MGHLLHDEGFAVGNDEGGVDLLMHVAAAFELHPIDHREGHAADLVRIVDPRMIGALLHHNVTGLQMQLGVVKQNVDFTLQHDAVVDGIGAMHERVIGVLPIALHYFSANLGGHHLAVALKIFGDGMEVANANE